MKVIVVIRQLAFDIYLIYKVMDKIIIAKIFYMRTSVSYGHTSLNSMQAKIALNTIQNVVLETIFK